MRRYSYYFLFLIVIFSFSCGKNQSVSLEVDYKNKELSINTRALALLSQMTLDEKIGQMTQFSISTINQSAEGMPKSMRFRPFIDTTKVGKLVREYHIGSFLAGFAVSAEQWYDFSYKLQKANLRNSRLKIPVIFGNDHIHGSNYINNGTIFPQAINLAATFNDTLATIMGSVTAYEIAGLGQHWNFAPVLDVTRISTWPRIYETMGESPLVIARMGKNYIEALQTEKSVLPYKVAATAKHFLGYSKPTYGFDRTSAAIPDQELYEIFVPPFKAAIDAGVKTFMINSGEVNGIPVHASHRLLTDLLRNQLGFKGVTVTDWADILQLIGQHKFAENEEEATKMALEAGIDMSMVATSVTFCQTVKKLVESGKMSQAVVDTAVTRILRLKFELGLFENPYPSKQMIANVGKPENHQKATEAARQSVVLLKNNHNILPIDQRYSNVVVAGPVAQSVSRISGGWTLEWMGVPDTAYNDTIPNLVEALNTISPNKFTVVNTSVDLVRAKSDLILLVLGEKPYAEGTGDIHTLDLDDEQIELVKSAQSTGKPYVIVMFAGRGRTLGTLIDSSDGFVFAGLTGPYGARAVAQLLTGNTDFEGKMPFSYPLASAGVPPHNTKAHDQYQPFKPFGFGLAYNMPELDTITVSDTIISPNRPVLVSAVYRANKPHSWPILLFGSDEARNVATPLRESLIDYRKVNFLGNGVEKVEFTINYNELKYPNEKNNLSISDGYFTFRIDNKKFKLYISANGSGVKPPQADVKDKHLQQNL